jgi:hypothetical protein
MNEMYVKEGKNVYETRTITKHKRHDTKRIRKGVHEKFFSTIFFI